jgi:predicted metal-dependent phosphoesterase TrpH
VAIGKALGYSALAITDHETDGSWDEFSAVCEKEGIEAVRGVEFYGMFEGRNLHLTALDFDPNAPLLRELIDERVATRYDTTKKRFELAVSRGFINEITWEDVVKYNAPNTWLCIGSIIRAYRTLRIPVPEDINYKVFKTPEADAFAAERPTAERVIRAVREAGGVIALAHPYKITHLIPELVKFGLNGVEVSHPDNKEDTSELAIEMATRYNLYHCGGTDHTGAMSGLGGRHARPALEGITEEEYLTLVERRKG